MLHNLAGVNVIAAVVLWTVAVVFVTSGGGGRVPVYFGTLGPGRHVLVILTKLQGLILADGLLCVVDLARGRPIAVRSLHLGRLGGFVLLVVVFVVEKKKAPSLQYPYWRKVCTIAHTHTLMRSK